MLVEGRFFLLRLFEKEGGQGFDKLSPNGGWVKHRLVPHDARVSPPISIGTSTTIVGSDVLRLEFVVTGTVSAVRLPGAALGERQDGLWRTTCFEAFVATTAGYVEMNFASSTQFASYRFEAYRAGMQPAFDLPAPEIFFEATAHRLRLVAWMDARRLLKDALGPLGLSAVIEETDGTKSYWALAHAPGPPDFHNPACFTATLPAPAGA